MSLKGMQVKRSRVFGVALLAIAGLNGNAFAADLLGESLSFLRAYPSTGTQYGQAIADTTVAAGTDDQVTWQYFPTGPALLTIDPEADRITFTFAVLGITEGSDTLFDGVVISGFDHAIESVSILDNTSGGTVLLSHGANHINVNLSGTFQPGQSFSVAVSVVPEPGSTALMALGLGMLALRYRRLSTVARPRGLKPPVGSAP